MGCLNVFDEAYVKFAGCQKRFDEAHAKHVGYQKRFDEAPAKHVGCQKRFDEAPAKRVGYQKRFDEAHVKFESRINVLANPTYFYAQTIYSLTSGVYEVQGQNTCSQIASPPFVPALPGTVTVP